MNGTNRASVFLFAIACATLCFSSAVAGSATPFNEPNAVLINLTEGDLNRVLTGAFDSAGASHIEGVRDRVAKGVFDLRYEAELSEPVLTLGEEGRLSLGLDIQSADVQIGRLERRIGKRTARCENAGIAVDAGRPVAFDLDFRFDVTDGELRVVPETVRLGNSGKDFRLVKPSRCENAILPRWLLWWVGKPQLRRRIARLDELLLAKAQEGAESFNGVSGLIGERWESDAGEIRLYPRTLDTSGGSLLLTLAGSTLAPADAPADPTPEWVGERRSGSFLALSEPFLNRALSLAVPGGATEPRIPGRSVRKLFRSRALYTLVPGLRGVAEAVDASNLHVSAAFSTPTIELDRIPAADVALDRSVIRESVAPGDDRALIRILVSGLELKLWNIDAADRSLLGTLRIDSGRIGAVPYANILGGISFELVENDWKLSSSGIEFSEHVLKATIQEMVFGEMFGSRFEPLAREALRIGDVDLALRGFRVAGGHLIIEVGEDPAPAPTRTDNLRASR